MTKIKNDFNESFSSNLVFLKENHFLGRLREYFILRIDSEISADFKILVNS